MRRLTALVAGLALATTVAACGGDDSDGDDGGGHNGTDGNDSESDDSDDASSGGVNQGGTFTYIAEQVEEAAPLNPFAAPTNSRTTINSLTLGYPKNSLTNPNDFYAGIADEWEIADDYSSVTVHIADDAKWSDGEDVTTEDVELSYKIAYTRGAGAFVLTPGAAGAVGEIEIIDEKTLTFTQAPENAVNTFPRGIMDVIVVPEHIWGDVLPADFDAKLEAAQAEGDAGDTAREDMAAIADQVAAFAPETDVSAGPFVFERASASDALFTKNEHFYGADNVAPDQLILKNYTGNQQIWDFVNAGETDATIFVATPPDIMSGFEANDNVGIHDAYSPVVAGWAFNQSRDPYGDLNVRKALAYLVDRDQAIQVGTPTAGSAPLATTGMHSEAFKEWLGDDVESLGLDPYANDPAMAEQLLNDAGFTNDGGTWKLPNGDDWTVTFQVVEGFSDWIAVAENIVTQLNEFGINAETQTSPDFTVYQEEMAAGEYDMGFWLLGLTPSPYDVFQRIYGQTNGWTVLGNSVSYSPPGENGNWMGGPETYDVDGGSVNPGELTVGLRNGPLEELGEDVLTLAKATNQNLPIIQFWDYSNTWFYTNSNFEGFENVPQDAQRLRAGVWFMEGWISAK
jgi:peptide/nickel transport system substrate-binding protein